MSQTTAKRLARTSSLSGGKWVWRMVTFSWVSFTSLLQLPRGPQSLSFLCLELLLPLQVTLYKFNLSLFGQLQPQVILLAGFRQLRGASGSAAPAGCPATGWPRRWWLLVHISWLENLVHEQSSADSFIPLLFSVHKYRHTWEFCVSTKMLPKHSYYSPACFSLLVRLLVRLHGHYQKSVNRALVMFVLFLRYSYI